MAYDEKLADRIRKRLGKRAGLTEKKMFGGIGFMLNGNMCCGVHGQEPDGLSNDAALAKWVRTGANYAATLPGKR